MPSVDGQLHQLRHRPLPPVQTRPTAHAREQAPALGARIWPVIEPPTRLGAVRRFDRQLPLRHPSGPLVHRRVARVPTVSPWSPGVTVAPDGSIPRWLPPVGLGLLAAAGTVYTGLLDPNTSDPFPLVPAQGGDRHRLPGLRLPRAVHVLAHLDVAGAIDHNVLFVLALPLILGAYFLWLARSLGWKVPDDHAAPSPVPGARGAGAGLRGDPQPPDPRPRPSAAPSAERHAIAPAPLRVVAADR